MIMDSTGNAFLSIFSLEFILKFETSINNSSYVCCLLYLQQNFWLITVSFVAAEISTTEMYQLYFLYVISWDKHHHKPI